MTVQERARSETLAIAVALHQLGGTASKEAIVVACGLSVRVVAQRLRSSSYNTTPEFHFFCRAENGTWGLTIEGQKLVTKNQPKETTMTPTLTKDLDFGVPIIDDGPDVEEWLPSMPYLSRFRMLLEEVKKQGVNALMMPSIESYIGDTSGLTPEEISNRKKLIKDVAESVGVRIGIPKQARTELKTPLMAVAMQRLSTAGCE